LDVLDLGQYLRFGGRITTELVGDDDPWDVLQSLQQLSEELLRSPLVPPRLHQDIEHFAVLIDGAPQVPQLAID